MRDCVVQTMRAFIQQKHRHMKQCHVSEYTAQTSYVGATDFMTCSVLKKNSSQMFTE